MGIFDWLFGDTDDEDAQLEDMLLMDLDAEDDQILCEVGFLRAVAENIRVSVADGKEM